VAGSSMEGASVIFFNRDEIAGGPPFTEMGDERS
jgi:hypothetical protein